jgi:hypothetical protein
MVSAASNQTFRREWIDVKGNYGLVKLEYLDTFRKTLEAQQKEAAKDYSRFAERMRGGGTSVELTEEQRKYLAEHFDPQNMSKTEYQEFIDKLCEFGILDEADKEYVGYGVKGCALDMIPVGRVRTGGSVRQVRENPMSYTDSFSSSGGNVAGWARYLSGIMSWSEQTNSWQRKPEAILFGKVKDVLEAVSR